MAITDNLTKFSSKFKTSSSRLQNFDYSTSGIYFITICTLNHNNFFGKIINNQMELSKMGLITKSELLKTFEIRKNLKLHQWVIMPNHIHLLMEIKYQIKNNNYKNNNINNVETPRRDVSTNQTNVSTITHNVSLISPNISVKNQNIHHPEIAIKNWQPNSIGSIICQFKSICTKRINPKVIFFAWQPRYHDIIVKDKKQYIFIKNYIQNNIANWQKDKFYRL